VTDATNKPMVMSEHKPPSVSLATKLGVVV